MLAAICANRRARIQWFRDEGFTHRGRLAGLIPVYVGDLESDEPTVTAANWVPEFAVHAALCASQLFGQLACLVSPEFEPTFSIWVTGRL
jgi:hypothetical protein